jgi:microcystin-dependent protein
MIDHAVPGVVGVDESDTAISTASVSGGSTNPLTEHTHSQGLGGSLSTTNLVAGDGIVGKSNSSNVSSTGNNTDHANWQPFITVYRWRRVA